MLVDNREVPQDGLPHHIEQIPEQREDTEGGFERDIRQHPNDLRARQPQMPGLVDE